MHSSVLMFTCVFCRTLVYEAHIKLFVYNPSRSSAPLLWHGRPQQAVCRLVEMSCRFLQADRKQRSGGEGMRTRAKEKYQKKWQKKAKQIEEWQDQGDKTEEETERKTRTNRSEQDRREQKDSWQIRMKQYRSKNSKVLEEKTEKDITEARRQNRRSKRGLESLFYCLIGEHRPPQHQMEKPRFTNSEFLASL